ncbi:MAG: hypothetical protein WDA22_11600 [Bacteroidota bacterium]
MTTHSQTLFGNASMIGDELQLRNGVSRSLRSQAELGNEEVILHDKIPL